METVWMEWGGDVFLEILHDYFVVHVNETYRNHRENSLRRRWRRGDCGRRKKMIL
jgi:hypothetical protein